MLSLLNHAIPFSKLLSLSSSSRTTQDEAPIYFPQFMSLPAELRLKIWDLAIEPRTHRVHFRLYTRPYSEVEEEEEAPGDLDALQSADAGLETGDGMGEVYGYLPDGSPTRRECNMVILPCNEPSCKCNFYPPSSRGALPLPATLYACSESREVALPQFSKCFGEEYNARGRPVTKRYSGLTATTDQDPVFPTVGLLLNPSIDAIIITTNIASTTAVRELHHVAAIVARQMPDLRKAVIELAISMPPYHFWSSRRFQYWTNWGRNPWWIPIKFLVQMKGLREVVLSRPFKDKMLPSEWRARILSQWEDELVKVKDKWPVEWEGKMPSLRFVSKLQDA